MAAGHLILSLRLFVLFFLVCKVRCSTGTRNCNITATCRMRESFFSCVIYYGPNRDAGYNACEIPLDCIHPNPGPVKNPCVLCERAIAKNHKFICWVRGSELGLIFPTNQKFIKRGSALRIGEIHLQEILDCQVGGVILTSSISWARFSEPLDELSLIRYPFPQFWLFLLTPQFFFFQF